jgi:hypothetical protein
MVECVVKANRYEVPGDHVYSQRPRFLQSPIDIPMINPYGRRTVFMLFESASPLSFANIVRVKATTQTGKELFSEDIPVTPVSRASTTIHVLAAKALMKDLENGRSWIHSSSYRERQTPEELDNMVRSEAQRLGCKYFLTGRWTSFVAIEFDAEAEREDYKMGEDLGLLQERRTANPDHSDSDSDSETDGPRDNSNGRGSHGGPPRRPPRGPPGGASGSSSGRFINSNSGRFGSRGPSGGNSSEAASKGGSLGNSTGRSTGNSLAIGSTNSYSKGVIHPFDQATPSLESEPSRVARIGPFDRSKSEAKSELNIDTLTSCLASPLPISMDRKKTLDNDPEDFSIFSAKTSKFSGLTDKTSKQKKRENASLDKLPRVGLLSRLKRKVKINSNSDTSTSQLASPLPIPMDRKSEPRSLLDTKSEPRSLLDTKSEPRSSLGTKMVPPIRLDRGREIDPYPDGIPSTLARTSGLSSTDPISKIREQGAAHRFSKNKLKSYNAGSGISYRTTTKTSDLVVEDWDKSPEKMAQEDIARCLISLQNYDGSFPEISDLLGDIYRTSKVGIDKEAWKYANNEWASGSAVPTIIAIAYFEEACRLCKELWELVVRKAMDYVTRAISDGTTRANLIRLTRSHIRSVLDVDALSSYLRHTQATKDNPSLANANDHREASQGTEPLPTSLSNMQKATGKASSPEDVLISSPTKAFDGLSEDQAHINSNFPVF